MCMREVWIILSLFGLLVIYFRRWKFNVLILVDVGSVIYLKKFICLNDFKSGFLKLVICIG